MIHGHPIPLWEGNKTFSSSAPIDFVVQGTFELDSVGLYCTNRLSINESTILSRLRTENFEKCLYINQRRILRRLMKAPRWLEEVWDDTTVQCPYGGYGMKNYSKIRIQWINWCWSIFWIFYFKKILRCVGKPHDISSQIIHTIHMMVSQINAQY